VQLGVLAAERHQVRVPALLGDAAIAQDVDPVRVPDAGQPHAATAVATKASDGIAARTRCGAGPAANSACSTPVVTSSAYPVNTPETTFSPIVVTRSRRLASLPSRIAWATMRGNCRAIARKLVEANRSFRRGGC
jgi:hypothetical protein